MRFREWLMRVMSGRYGSDTLNQTLMWVCIGLAAVNVLFRTPVLTVLGYLALLLLVFRMFSRNTAKRAAENRKFLEIVGRVRGSAAWRKLSAFCVLTKNRIRDRKTHVYRTCPHCGATLRLAKYDGASKRISVNCPRCHQSFETRF